MEAIFKIYLKVVDKTIFFGVWRKAETYNPLDFSVFQFNGHHCTSAFATGYTYRELHVLSPVHETHIPLYLVQAYNNAAIDWGIPEDPLDTSGDSDGTIQNSILTSIIATLTA